ncbi:autotransporter domain-containing protein [Bradyrhizobium sp. NBAIM02]|uniref:autotransporter outer membrane beta-barrel domain-containing protein n=1 Tax=Bradyrhizobium sp. NBAIM02 TaxID=2793817 RepID=UPI001CD47B1D|nr:autotransporter domain-containing protein [Bradyrhizobium sp. NBAIM02]
MLMVLRPAGVTNLTVNVLTGATVNDNGTASINVNDTNFVTNNGTVSAGSGLTGINGANSNTVTNNGNVTVIGNGLGISLLSNNTIANNGTINTGDGGAAISVQDNNVIGNSGALSVGAGSSGIFAGVNNTITNSASGTITGLDNTIGIYVFGNASVTNAGAVSVGASIGSSGGIFAINDGNTVTNAATGSISVGQSATGIFAQGNTETVSNAGSISVAQFGMGIAVIGHNAKVTNTGTVTGVDSTAGMQVQGNFAVVTQNGTVNVGVGGMGIGLTGVSGTLTNNGTIVGGDGAYGTTLLGDDNVVTNRGTITVGDIGTGIYATTISTTNQIVNTGTINVGVNGVGISLSNGGSVFNSGTINAATGFAAIDLCGCSNSILTLGPGSIINGQVLASGTDTFQLGGSGKDTFNLGLIGTGLQYDGFSTFNKIDSSAWTVTGNVANALTRVFNTTGSLPVALANLTPEGLTQASGESATGSQQTTFNAMNLFLGLLTEVYNSGRGGMSGATPYASDVTANAYAARRQDARDAFASIYRKAPAATFEQRWDVWAAGYGGSQATDGHVALGSNDTTSSVYGTAVGLDYRFSPSTLAGFALAGGGTSFGVNGLGWGRSDLFQAGAFVRHTTGPAYVTAALAYGWQDVTTNRVVTAAGFDQLRAQFNTNAFSGRVEGGYRYAMQWAGVTPYAALQATLFSLPSYAEAAVVGSNVFALNYAAKDVTSTRSELGLRADRSFAAAGGLMTLRGRLAWAHDYNPDRTLSAVFQTLPGSALVVNGAAQARDSALTTASVLMNWMNGWSASATFEGEFSNVTRSYAGKGRVRYAW